MPRPKPPALTLAELKALLRQIVKKVAKLQRQKARHQRAIAALDAQIARLQGFARPGRPPKARAVAGKPAAAVPPTGRKRGRRPLRDLIVEVLSRAEGPLRPKQIAQAVRRTGYVTRSKDFVKRVGIVLLKAPGVVRRARGLYTVAPSAGQAARKSETP